MSLSPPIRRLSTTSSSSKREEDLINAYEAEEERIINVLSRKLEKLQEEKIELENVLEAESESHVNRLSRELSALRLAQQLAQAQSQNQAQSQSQYPNHVNGDHTATSAVAGGGGGNGDFGRRVNGMMVNPLAPSSELMLEAMRKENEQLRNRMVDMEREYIRITRLNEIYREELIDHRRRLGVPVDNLIGLPTSHDPYSQPTHRRSTSASNNISSPLPIPSTSSNGHPSNHHPSAPMGVPIPRPPSQIHRPSASMSMSLSLSSSISPSSPNTPLSHSPSSPSSSQSQSPYLSPTTSTNPASYLSHTSNLSAANTHLTTPSSSSFTAQLFMPNTVYGYGAMPSGGTHMGRLGGLSYPSVPPPSLSSSFGGGSANGSGSGGGTSPSVAWHGPGYINGTGAGASTSSATSTTVGVGRERSDSHTFNHQRDMSSSPVEAHTSRWGRGLAHGAGVGAAVARRGSFERRVPSGGETYGAGFTGGSLSRPGSRSRRESVERGARIAETGQLVPRSRGNSMGAGTGIGVGSVVSAGVGGVEEVVVEEEPADGAGQDG